MGVGMKSDYLFSMILSLVRSDTGSYTRGWTDGFLAAVADHLEEWQLAYIDNIIHARRNLEIMA